MKTFLLLSIILMVIVMTVVGLWLVSISRPTRGPKIRKYRSPQKALLVIDIQEDVTGKTTRLSPPYREADKAIAAINQVIGAATQNNLIVIYIRQEFEGVLGKLFSRIFARGATIKGHPGCALDRRIAIVPGHDFSKPVGDAFSNPEMEKFLISRHIDELWMVGADAEFCVHLTAKSARQRGYRVNVIPEGLLLRAEKKWDKILKQYQKEGIGILPMSQFLQKNPRI
jgi:nicotinamidase/pyrazinamidase